MIVVPPDMCLLSCVFFITDYQKILGQEEVDTWKQVIYHDFEIWKQNHVTIYI